MSLFEFKSLDGKLRVDLGIYSVVPYVSGSLVEVGYLYPSPFFISFYSLNFSDPSRNLVFPLSERNYSLHFIK